jgi:DNA polymerase III subunit delta
MTARPRHGPLQPPPALCYSGRVIYVLYGPEPLQKREALQALKQRLDTDGALATNTATLDARQSSPQEVIAACDTVPFLAEVRLVVVEGALTAGARGRKRSRKADDTEDGADSGEWGALAEHAERMPPTTTLVLMDGDVTSKNPLLRALLLKGAKVEHYDAPGPKDLPGWVSRRANAIGVQLDGRAGRLLAELVGPDLWLLSNEMEKLKTYAGGGTVREQDVRELVAQARELKAWLLADAVTDGQPAKAAKLLQELLEQEQHPAGVLANIQGRYRMLAIVRDMLDHGASESAIAATLRRKNNYGLQILIEHAQRMPLAAIRRAYRRLVQAELDVRRGLSDADVSLELAVQDLATPRRAA